jgi:hypothetical protein
MPGATVGQARRPPLQEDAPSRHSKASSTSGWLSAHDHLLDLDLVTVSDFSFLIERIFATDRNDVPKGLVEVIP